ncbi:MAG: hypothetical protein JHC74_15385, partial [Thermoleophilia bacterium]|nr:hypothetical protein [Thermoleophilia bacterium]
AGMRTAALTPPAVRNPAARGRSTRYDRRARRLVVTLRGAAPRAVVEVNGRRVIVRGSTLVLRGIGPGQIVLRVSAPATAGVVFGRAAFRITVRAGAPVRVGRL